MGNKMNKNNSYLQGRVFEFIADTVEAVVWLTVYAVVTVLTVKGMQKRFGRQ